MLRIVTTGAVYLVGCAVFAFICFRILDLGGVPAPVNRLISCPVGMIAFGIFIWLNWDNDFAGWQRRRPWKDDDGEDDAA